MTVSDSHLDQQVVIDFVDGRLSGQAKREAAAHLARCAACREEVLAAGAVLAEHQKRRWRSPLSRVTAVAAVLLLLIGGSLISGRSREVDSAPSELTRAIPSVALAAVQPAPNAVLDLASPISLAWTTIDRGSHFRVAVLDEQGVTLWSTETSDTAVTLPASLSLKSGRAYFWYVDALGADGRSLTTGAIRFEVR